MNTNGAGESLEPVIPPVNTDNLCPLCGTQGILSGPGVISKSIVRLTFQCPNCRVVFRLQRVHGGPSVVQYFSDPRFEHPSPRLQSSGRQAPVGRCSGVL